MKTEFKGPIANKIIFDSCPGYPNYTADQIQHDLLAVSILDTIEYIAILATEDELSSKYGKSLDKAYAALGLKSSIIPLDRYAIPGNLKNFDILLSKIDKALHKGDVILQTIVGNDRQALLASCLYIKNGIMIDEIPGGIIPKLANRTQYDFLEKYQEFISE